jgi:hypothetical protein
VELFTDFEITFFLDPSGDLMDEAAKRKKAVVLKAGTGLQKTGQN